MTPTSNNHSRVSRPNTHRRRILRWALVVLTVLGVVAAGVVPFVGSASAQETVAADIVIVIDRTPNMENDRDVLAEEIASYARELEDDRIDARFAVVAYERSGQNNTAVVQGFTRDRDALSEAFEYETFGTIENASGGILTAASLDYRQDAERVLVVISDEDDDGTSDSREAALDAVERLNATLVAVSPDQNDVDDLQRMALISDGRWVDIENRPFETVLDDLFDVVTREVKDIPDSDEPARFEVTGTFNRSEVEVGEPVGLTVDIANVGGQNGSIIYLLEVDGDLVNQSNGGIKLEPGEVVTVSETLTLDRRGGYNIEVSNRLVGRVTVTALRETNATVGLRDTPAGDDRLALSVRDARAGDPVTLELPTLQAGRDSGVVFDELRITPNEVVRNLTADVRQTTTKPPDTPARPDGVRPFLTWLRVDATGAERVENVTFGLRVSEANLEGLPPENLAVYRYAGTNSGGWTALETNVTAEANGTYRYEVVSPGFSTFAVGVRDGEFTVVDANASARSVGVGESVTVDAVIENTGEFDGDYRAVLSANGEFVNDTVVRVPAGEARNVSFTVAFDTAGEYRLAVGERGAGRVTVEPSATPTPTATPAAEPTPTPTATDPATPSASPTATATPGSGSPASTATDGQPGFGPAVALVSLAGAMLLWSRRD